MLTAIINYDLKVSNNIVIKAKLNISVEIIAVTDRNRTKK